MALPTAQLGQLGNMNMPYAIPQYNEEPSIWEKALASFLVSAASGTAKQGVDNFMSQDYAPEFGEDKASRWQRLVQGPRVGAADASMRRRDLLSAEQQQLGRTHESDLQSERLLAGQGQSDADAANARLREGDRAQAGLDQQAISDMNALIRGDRDATARIELEQEQARLRTEDPLYQSQKRYYDSMAGKNQGETDFLRGIISGRPGAGGGAQAPGAGVNKNIADFAKNGAAGTVPTPAPAQPADFVSGPEDIARLLASGMSPEQVVAVVTKQRTVDAAAQSRPLPSTTPQEDPRVAEIMRLLGMPTLQGTLSDWKTGL